MARGELVRLYWINQVMPESITFQRTVIVRRYAESSWSPLSHNLVNRASIVGINFITVSMVAFYKRRLYLLKQLN